MAVRTDRDLSLLDQNGTPVGTIRVLSESNAGVIGEFSPTGHFNTYASLFMALEHAANEMLLVECDELQRKVDALNFCVREGAFAAERILDLQIMTAGVSFRWNDPSVDSQSLFNAATMQWAYINWFPEDGAHLIHAEDVERLLPAVQGRVGVLLPAQGDWIPVAFGMDVVRVNVKVLHSCLPPEFSYGQTVSTLPPRSPRIGKIVEIGWHFDRQVPIFYVGVQRIRYLAHELKSS
jgi:hypothetical protein